MASGGSGVKADAIQQYGNSTGQAQSAYNTLDPIYSQWATNPQGLTPQQKSDMLTASGQSLGGGVAAATGEGNLDAARTGNEGAMAGALDDAARQAQVQQSQNALGVENQDAQLARRQQEMGVAGLDSIYNHAGDMGQSYLALANNAKPSFWQQFGSQAAFGALKAAQSGAGGDA